MSNQTNWFQYVIKREVRRICIPFLTGGVPKLSFDGFLVDMNASCSELDTDGRL